MGIEAGQRGIGLPATHHVTVHHALGCVMAVCATVVDVAMDHDVTW